MEKALTFNAVEFVIVTRNNQPWVRVSQIATALGYVSVQRVTELYTRHADEFTDEMTAVVKLPTEGGEQDVRIFSLRGCHLLAMFARTPVAKAFRKWVLDVLDTLERERQPVTDCHALPDSITPEQQAQLHAIVAAKVGMLPREVQRKAYAEAWTRFCRHFRIARYSQLPPAKMGEAVDYLVSVEWAAAKALPSGVKESLTTEVPALPVPEDGPKQLDVLQKAREKCRWDFIPKAYSSLDREAAERAHLAKDLYKLQDCLWAALYNVCSAAARLRK